MNHQWKKTEIFTLLLLLIAVVVLSGCGHYGMGRNFSDETMHNQQNWNHPADRRGYGTTHGPY